VPLNSELLRAIELLDGSADTSASRTPTSAGLYHRPRTGHILILDSCHHEYLAAAVKAELVLFGRSVLSFGLGVRFYDAAGEAGRWISIQYAWGVDPGKWRVAPVGDTRLIPPEERIITISIPVVGEGTRLERQVLLPLDFTAYLRNRIGASEKSRTKPSWMKDQVAQFGRIAESGIMNSKTHERTIVDLLPVS
jgi:hypothetical protein